MLVKTECPFFQDTVYKLQHNLRHMKPTGRWNFYCSMLVKKQSTTSLTIIWIMNNYHRLNQYTAATSGGNTPKVSGHLPVLKIKETHQFTRK